MNTYICVGCGDVIGPDWPELVPVAIWINRQAQQRWCDACLAADAAADAYDGRDDNMHDQKSYELAEHFASDEEGCTKADLDSLADAIQRAVEDWLEGWHTERAHEAAAREPQPRDTP